MDLEERLRASLVAPDPGAIFTARVMARVGRGATRRRSRFILIGTVLMVSAAAAMLAWRMSVVQPPPVESAALPAVSGAEQQVVQAIPEGSEPAGATPRPVPPGDISSHFSVLVMPLRQEAQDGRKRGPVEAFYAATLDELRKVPGLTLLVPGESEQGARGKADYVLTITSLASRVTQSGGVVVSTTDGRTTYSALDGGVVMVSGNGGSGIVLGGGGTLSSNGGLSRDPESAVWIEMKVESRRSAVSRYTLSVDAEDTIGQRRCNSPNPGASVTYYSRVTVDGPNGSAAAGSGAVASSTNLVLSNRLSGFNVDMDYGVSEAGGQVSRQRESLDENVLEGRIRPPECMTPVQLAANQVEVLRLEVFPPNAAFQQLVVAQLGSASMDQAGEERFLQVLRRLTSDGGARLDGGTVQAIVRFAAGQSARVRAGVWSTLRFARVSHPALLAPLVESLRHDADQQVKLAALDNLEASYSTDPVVRGALELAARDEPDPRVRVAVRRVLYGQTQWRNEILAGLQGADLTYEARLAPLLANGPLASPPQQEYRRAALQEQQVLRPLITLIREHLRDSDHAVATSDVLGVLGSVDDPAVFDLFISLMRETSMLDREITVRANSIEGSGPVTSWVASHRNDPRVIQSLSDADPRLRAVFEPKGKTMDVTIPPVPVEPMVPANLIRRMREVTEKQVPPAPLACCGAP